MAHDHNGRVGPPRCEECNAPLNSDDPLDFDDPQLHLVSSPSLCLDCHLERNPFPRFRKKRRTLAELRITVADCLTPELTTMFLSS
jgi:hypothetical protein